MKINHKAALSGSQLAARKVYAPPALNVFGPVGALTQGGTMTANENSGAPLELKRP